MLLMVMSALGYAVWTDTITIQYTLISAHAPTISVSKGFINLGYNLVTINVRKSDKVIISTSPDVVRIFVNVTNKGATPINMIVVTDVLPENWSLHPENVQVQLIREDEAIVDIGNSYFTMSYDSDSRTLTVIVDDILVATGKYLLLNEKIRIMFNMEYELKWEMLPSEYEANPPNYINTATATAWIRQWSSETIVASATFATAINWVGP